MDFTPTARTQELTAKLTEFMEWHIYPNEKLFEQQQAEAEGASRKQPQILEDLKAKAREQGLWNLFMPHSSQWSEPLSNLEYAPLAEIMGRSIMLAPEAFNCNPPDTGNMELLNMFATDEQKEDWLKPLLDGQIRSSYLMTEPHVASSDASGIQTRIVRDGDDYVVNGRKWFITGARRERTEIYILMGVTDPDGPRHRRHSQILIPRDTPGVEITRDLHLMGYAPYETHSEVHLNDVRVPASNLLGEEGAGFAMAQARLGPGRIHHCMRMIGLAERALELMIDRANKRTAFGGPLSEQGVVREWIADSRMEIDQARLYTLYTAWLMDTVGNRQAASEISGIKVVVPNMATRVIDRAIQMHGAGGLSQDFPLARAWVEARSMRFADGPDEVHRRGVARAELKRFEAACTPERSGLLAHLREH